MKKITVNNRSWAHYIGMIPILLSTFPSSAWAWGDEGHEVVVAIALHYLSPNKLARLNDLLAQDSDSLTAHDPVSSAVWADRHRDAHDQGRHANYRLTHEWHFVDLELQHPNLRQACHDFPSLGDKPASAGPPSDCVVSKIEQFSEELRHYRQTGFPATQLPEAILAVKYLMHFIGDLHQPLHAIDNHDRGGNDLRVKWDHARMGSLHHYWDSTFIERMDPDTQHLASTLSAAITPANVHAWQQGTPRDWAREAFATARDQAYAPLPEPDERGHYRLSDAYAHQAMTLIGFQLEEAGVRLAYLLDQVL